MNRSGWFAPTCIAVLALSGPWLAAHAADPNSDEQLVQCRAQHEQCAKGIGCPKFEYAHSSNLPGLIRNWTQATVVMKNCPPGGEAVYRKQCLPEVLSLTGNHKEVARAASAILNRRSSLPPPSMLPEGTEDCSKYDFNPANIDSLDFWCKNLRKDCDVALAIATAEVASRAETCVRNVELAVNAQKTAQDALDACQRAFEQRKKNAAEVEAARQRQEAQVAQANEAQRRQQEQVDAQQRRQQEQAETQRRREEEARAAQKARDDAYVQSVAAANQKMNDDFARAQQELAQTFAQQQAEREQRALAREEREAAERREERREEREYQRRQEELALQRRAELEALPRATLNFESNPPGAVASVDGRPGCPTPCQQTGVVPEPHAVGFELAGHVPQRIDVAPKPGETLQVRVTLIAQGTLLVLSQPAGAGIQIDGAGYNCVTPCRIPGITPGSHQVRLTRPGHADSVTQVQVQSAAEARAEGTLHAYPPSFKVANLSCGDVPVRVSVGGAVLQPSADGTFTGRAGENTVRLEADGCTAVERTVVLTPAQAPEQWPVIEDEPRRYMIRRPGFWVVMGAVAVTVGLVTAGIVASVPKEPNRYALLEFP